MGVVPEIVEADTGLKTWNLGTIGWLYTDGHAALLSLYLERFKPPRLLVYHVTDYVFKTRWPEIRSRESNLRRFCVWSGACEGAPWADRLPSARAWYLLKFYFSKFRGLRKPGLLAQARGPFPSDAELRQTLEATRGYLREPRAFEFGKEDFAPPTWTADCAPGLRRILELSAKHSIAVLIVMSPLPESARSPEMERAYRELELHLRQVLAAYPRARLYSPFLHYYSESYFGAGGHLNDAGAERNSHEISSYLMKAGIIGP